MREASECLSPNCIMIDRSYVYGIQDVNVLLRSNEKGYRLNHCILAL